MGSNAVKVARNLGHCPLLVIPSEVQLVPPSHIVFATAFRHGYDTALLAPLRYLAALEQAIIDVFYVYPEYQFELDGGQMSNRQALLAHLEDFQVAVPTRRGYDSVARALLDHAIGTGCDLMVLVHQKYGLLERLFREPVVKRVAFQTTLPLLILPNGLASTGT